MVVESAKVPAGQDISNVEVVHEMFQLILKPGVLFWSMNMEASRRDVVGACEAVFEQEIVQRFSQTS